MEAAVLGLLAKELGLLQAEAFTSSLGPQSSHRSNQARLGCLPDGNKELGLSHSCADGAAACHSEGLRHATVLGGKVREVDDHPPQGLAALVPLLHVQVLHRDHEPLLVEGAKLPLLPLSFLHSQQGEILMSAVLGFEIACLCPAQATLEQDAHVSEA